MAREEHAQALQEKVQRATFEQVKDQLESDFRALRASLPTRDSQAIETAKDMKYMKDRQLHFDRNAYVLFFCTRDVRISFGLNIDMFGGHRGFCKDLDVTEAGPTIRRTMDGRALQVEFCQCQG